MIKKVSLCLALLLALSSLTGCGSKAASGSAEVSPAPAVSEEAASSETEEEPDCSEEMRPVLDAVEDVSNQPTFGITTSAVLCLNGHVISGEFDAKSEVHVSQGEDHSDMLMSMRSSMVSTDGDSEDDCAYYKDGWYYLDDVDGKQKEQKTPEEILSLISEMTDLVKEGAKHITAVDTAQEGEDTVYTFELPDYLAERYLKKLAAMEKSGRLKGARIDVDTAVLSSVVGPDGLLRQQRAEISGTIHKSLFAVPAEAEFTADFETPDTGRPEIETW